MDYLSIYIIVYIYMSYIYIMDYLWICGLYIIYQMIDYTCDICSIQIDTILWCTYYTYYTYIYTYATSLYVKNCQNII